MTGLSEEALFLGLRGAGLTIEEAEREEILCAWGALSAMAHLVMEFQLADDAEPAAMFLP